jgi:hypothetical protein
MDSNSKTVGFKLLKVTTEQFATIEECFNDKEKVKLGANLRFAANDKSRTIGIFSELRFNCQQKVFLVIEAGCHFQIQSPSWETMIKDNNLTVPKGFMQHLAVITIGTARGILHAKTEGTPFNRFVLPTINITELVKQDVVFTFN